MWASWPETREGIVEMLPLEQSKQGHGLRLQEACCNAIRIQTTRRLAGRRVCLACASLRQEQEGEGVARLPQVILTQVVKTWFARRFAA